MPRIIRISHIGIAVDAVGPALDLYSGGLGMQVSGAEEVASDAVRAVFLPVGESRLELLAPVGESGPLHKFLANRGEGIHHICFEVEDLAEMLSDLRGMGVELIDNEPRTGAHGTLVAFIHPKAAHGVLIELVETGSQPESGAQ